MSASFVASFFIFLLTGIYSITTRLDFTKDGFVKGFVVAALFANALYYHYVASYTELDDDVRNALKDKTRFEWVISDNKSMHSPFTLVLARTWMALLSNRSDRIIC